MRGRGVHYGRTFDPEMLQGTNNHKVPIGNYKLQAAMGSPKVLNW